ncbi:MAG: HAD family phosphatase [Roseburia sp.]|nr:HAD family phosphatase [Roseburia sp.]
MLEGIKAVIFDLDGTLVDSMWMWRDIDMEFLAARNLPFEEDLQEKIEGMSFTETARYFREYFDLKETVDELKQIWNEMAMEKYRHEVPLKEGAGRFLEYLKESGIKMGIATSNSSELVEAVSDAHRLNRYISCVITACSVNRGKPAPDVYLEAARQLEVLPEDCLVFEDIVKGMEAGKNAGMKVCGVEDDYSIQQREKKRQTCDYYIRSFQEIFDNTYEIMEHGR